MAYFPELTPSRRSIALSDYPVKTYRSLSGKIYKRAYGNRPYGMTMELEFANITQDKVKLIFDHYYGQDGTLTGFNLTSAAKNTLVLADFANGSDLKRQLQEGDPYLVITGQTGKTAAEAGLGMKWYYQEPPAIESVFKGISTVTVRLVSEFVNE